MPAGELIRPGAYLLEPGALTRTGLEAQYWCVPFFTADRGCRSAGTRALSLFRIFSGAASGQTAEHARLGANRVPGISISALPDGGRRSWSVLLAMGGMLRITA